MSEQRKATRLASGVSWTPTSNQSEESFGSCLPTLCRHFSSESSVLQTRKRFSSAEENMTKKSKDDQKEKETGRWSSKHSHQSREAEPLSPSQLEHHSSSPFKITLPELSQKQEQCAVNKGYVPRGRLNADKEEKGVQL
jgi:hypothetical protein